MDQETNLGRLLLDRFRWFDESLRATLERSGWPKLSFAQSMVFASLDPEGTSQAELARRIGVTRQAVFQTVADLIDMGLVELLADPTDGRARLVYLTDAGRLNVMAALGAFDHLEERLVERIGARRVGELRRSLGADWGKPLGAGQEPL